MTAFDLVTIVQALQRPQTTTNSAIYSSAMLCAFHFATEKSSKLQYLLTTFTYIILYQLCAWAESTALNRHHQ